MHSRKRESALKYHFSVNFAILFMPTFDVLTQNIAFWHILGTSKAILLIFVLKCNEYNGPILLCIPLFINGTYLFGIFREKEQVLFMTAWPIATSESTVFSCKVTWFYFWTPVHLLCCPIKNSTISSKYRNRTILVTL